MVCPIQDEFELTIPHGDHASLLAALLTAMQDNTPTTLGREILRLAEKAAAMHLASVSGEEGAGDEGGW